MSHLATRSFASGLAALLLAAGCSGPPEIHRAHGRPTDLSQLAQSKWTAEEIEGSGVMGGHRPLLIFENRTHVSGSGGCNQFSGPVAKEGARIQVGDLAVTTMACSPEVDEQEQRFLAALKKPARLQRGRNKLYFVGEHGKVTLRFEREFKDRDRR